MWLQTWQLRSWQLYCISFFRIDGRVCCFGECWFWTNGNKQTVYVTILCSKSILWRPWKWVWIQCVAVCSNATWNEYRHVLRVQSWKVCLFLCILQVTLRRRFGDVYMSASRCRPYLLLNIIRTSPYITETFSECVTWARQTWAPPAAWALAHFYYAPAQHLHVALPNHIPGVSGVLTLVPTCVGRERRRTKTTADEGQ